MQLSTFTSIHFVLWFSGGQVPTGECLSLKQWPTFNGVQVYPLIHGGSVPEPVWIVKTVDTGEHAPPSPKPPEVMGAQLPSTLKGLEISRGSGHPSIAFPRHSLDSRAQNM